MATVPQPYLYSIASLPGGEFEGEHSDRLLYLIESQLPAATGATVNSDGTDVEVTFDEDLEDTDKAILDALVPHCTDFYIITSDGGVTDLGDPAQVEKSAGLLSATTMTLQVKLGDGSNYSGAGFGEEIILHAPLMTISALEGSFDSNGQFSFTIGAELNRGEIEISIEPTGFAVKTLVARWI